MVYRWNFSIEERMPFRKKLISFKKRQNILNYPKQQAFVAWETISNRYTSYSKDPTK